MSRDVALERNEEGLRTALEVIVRLETTSAEPALSTDAAAKLDDGCRPSCEQSRGGHWRSDYPRIAKDAARTFMTLADAERIAANVEALPRHHARK